MEQSRRRFFPGTKILNTDSRDDPGEWNTACRMYHHEECHGISHGSRTGRVIWKLSESNLYEEGPSRYGPPTTTHTVKTKNTAANSIVNGTAKQKISRAIDMIFYWVRDRIRQNHLHILREEGKKNLADYVTKHHPIWHHRSMRPKYVKATKTYIEDSKF